MNVRQLLAILLLLISSPSVAFTYRDSSRLVQGNWIKLRISETGIYKLTYNDLLQMGLKHPEKAKIYGYGGWKLNQVLKTDQTDDLPQVAVWRETGNDGVFNNGDFILFYGRGPLQWNYNEKEDEYIHQHNPYSNHGYYFISDNEEDNLEVAEAKQPNSTNVQYTTDTYDYYARHETDLYNYLQSGCEYYGEAFNTTPQRFSFYIPGITNDPGRLTVDMVSNVDPAYPASYTVHINDTEYINHPFPTNSASNRHVKAKSAKKSVEWHGKKEESNQITIQYKRKGPEYARLNYIRLNCKTKLQLQGSHTFFRDKQSRGKTTRYQLSATTSGIKVWDVTSANQIYNIPLQHKDDNYSFLSSSSDTIREYVIFNPNANFPKPDILGNVPNQNLHAITQAEMVIITQPNLRSQAEVIANIHRLRENMSVVVIEPEKIYNEFSSGTPDATAYRRFLKMLVDKKVGGDFLLLFGDGTYDNRLLTNDSPYQSPFEFILTYQSPNSISDFNSYVTDDYFGFINDDEGATLGNDQIDLCVGRIPVSTPNEANGYVAKLLTYINNQHKGVWKNNITFWADDEDNNLHMEQADQLAQKIESNYPQFIVNKVYIDAFKQQTTTLGNSYPDAKKKLNNLIENGQLIINYTGHGSVMGLTGEDLFTKSDIQNMPHNDKPALWITATCDFTRFDNSEQSAGEKLLLNKQSGAIATFSTTRIVNASPNFSLNKTLLDNLFLKKNGKRLRLGEVMRNTKRVLGNGDNKLNFTLFGDPALYLSYPEYKINVTTFKGKPVGKFGTDTIKALETITLSGTIVTPADTMATQFNGPLTVTVFDSKETIQTLNNDGTADEVFNFSERSRILYSGNTTVKNGEFSLSFTVPKDISYSLKSGSINLYAHDDQNNEAQGVFNRFVVGGTGDQITADTIGPRIAVYLNDTTFSTGGKVNETPLLIVHAQDESGINKSGNSIGHDITLILDKNTNNPIILNNYFENMDNGKEGVLRYRLEELSEGIHTLYFKIWDIYNNSSALSIDFEVVKGLKPSIEEVYVLDDRESGLATFHIHHSSPLPNTEITIEILDSFGQSLWKNHETVYSNSNDYAKTWNKTGYQGNKLPAGLYLYRVSITPPNAKTSVKSGKIILSEQ